MSSELHARAKELFLAASDLPHGARQTFLDERCAGHEELKREVLSLLSFFDSGGLSGIVLRRRAADRAEDGANSDNRKSF